MLASMITVLARMLGIEAWGDGHYREKVRAWGWSHMKVASTDGEILG
jgi:hypothetical protein